MTHKTMKHLSDMLQRGIVTKEMVIMADSIPDPALRARTKRFIESKLPRGSTLKAVASAPAAPAAPAAPPQSSFVPSIASSGFDILVGVDAIRAQLELNFMLPLRQPQIIAMPNAGILLYGPPGTGKTSIVRALSHETSIPMVAVQLEQLLDKYVGGTEQSIASLFDNAAKYVADPAHRHVILFFDDIDVLFRQHVSGDSPAYGGARTVLLNRMESVPGVFVFAATNNVASMDPAIRRRFALELEVPLPGAEAIANMLHRGAARVVSWDWCVQWGASLALAWTSCDTVSKLLKRACDAPCAEVMNTRYRRCDGDVYVADPAGPLTWKDIPHGRIPKPLVTPQHLEKVLSDYLWRTWGQKTMPQESAPVPPQQPHVHRPEVPVQSAGGACSAPRAEPDHGYGGGTYSAPRAEPDHGYGGGTYSAPRAEPDHGYGGGTYSAPRAEPTPGTGGAINIAPRADPAPGTGGAINIVPRADPAPGTGGAINFVPRADPDPGTGGAYFAPRAEPDPGTGGAYSAPRADPDPGTGGAYFAPRVDETRIEIS